MALKHFIIDIEDNSNKFQVPFPYYYEGENGFVLIDFKGNVVFASSTSVKNLEHLFDNAYIDDEEIIEVEPPPDKCTNILTFDTTALTQLIGNLNQFTVTVRGNNNHIVQFKSSLEDWKDANIGTNSCTIKTPATGGNEVIKCRIKDCVVEVTQLYKSLLYVAPIEDGKETLVGTWKTFELITKTTGNTNWLIQTNTNRTFYIPRGINFPEDDKYVILTATLDKTKLDNEVTGTGGLNPAEDLTKAYPAKWNVQWWKDNGYSINGSKEWVKTTAICVNSTWTNTGNSKCVDNVSYIERVSNCGETEWILGGTACTQIIVDNSIIPYKLEPTINTIDFNQFDSITVPEGYLIVGGYGAPAYSNLGTRDGLAIPYKIGYTHFSNLESLPFEQWATNVNGKWIATRAYYFQQFHHLAEEAVKLIFQQNRYLGEYGYLEGIYNPANGASNKDYSKITMEGALEIGRTIGNLASVVDDHGTQVYNVPAPGSYLFMDEEGYDLNLGDYATYISSIYKGFKEAFPLGNTMYYGAPVTWLLNQNQNSSTITDNMLEEEITNGYSIFQHNNFKSAKTSIDCSGGYFKVPGIIDKPIYKKDANNNFIVISGKRQYINTEFAVNHFGVNYTILPEPHDWIKYWLINGNGQQLFGSFYVDNAGTNNPTVKEPWKTQGYNFYHSARPVPSMWQPETELYVNAVYRYANTLMISLLKLTKVEFNDFNITDRRARTLIPGAVRCPNTEPFTTYGNSVDRRYIGEQLSLYDYIFPLLTGIQTIESWADGRNLNTLQSQGNYAFGSPNDEGGTPYLSNHSSYIVNIAGVQSVLKPLQGINPNTFKFIHFYYPVIGQQNSEIISSGIYVGNKFIVMFLNPTLEFNEQQTFTLKVGTSTFNYTLVGRKVLLKVLTVPSGVSPTDFTLDYYNIYAKRIKVNGKVTNKISEHYI